MTPEKEHRNHSSSSTSSSAVLIVPHRLYADEDDTEEDTFLSTLDTKAKENSNKENELPPYPPSLQERRRQYVDKRFPSSSNKNKQHPSFRTLPSENSSRENQSSMPTKFKPRQLPQGSHNKNCPPTPPQIRNKRSYDESGSDDELALYPLIPQPQLNTQKNVCQSLPSPVRKSHKQDIYHPASERKVRNRRGSSEMLMIPMLGQFYPSQQQKQIQENTNFSAIGMEGCKEKNHGGRRNSVRLGPRPIKDSTTTTTIEEEKIEPEECDDPCTFLFPPETATYTKSPTCSPRAALPPHASTPKILPLEEEDTFGMSISTAHHTPRLYNKSPHYVKSPHWSKSVSVNPFSPVPQEYLCPTPTSKIDRHDDTDQMDIGLYGKGIILYGGRVGEKKGEKLSPIQKKTVCTSTKKKRTALSRIPTLSSSGGHDPTSSWCLFDPTENDNDNEEKQGRYPTPNMNGKDKEKQGVSPTDIISASFSPTPSKRLSPQRPPPQSTLFEPSTAMPLFNCGKEDETKDSSFEMDNVPTMPEDVLLNSRSQPPSLMRRKSPRRRTPRHPMPSSSSFVPMPSLDHYNTSSSSPMPQCRPTLPDLSPSPTPQSPSSTTSTNTKSSRFHDDFQEVGILGSGSFGSVYKCISRLDGCLYAVKVVKRECRGEIARHHMLKEVYALAALCNQSDGSTFHIVRYHQAWMEENRLYIQTELCTSTLLNEISRGVFQQNADDDVEKRNERCYKLLREILLALELIHKNDMVHLDIKPDNIFVKNDQYKLGDFGLAHKAAHNSDVEEGDARYMSKELLSGDLDDLTKCDIFSLGATMYQVCLGRSLPPNGQEWQDIRAGVLLPLPGTQPELRGIIADMMHPEPEQRPAATELLKRRQLLSKEKQELIVEENKVKELSMALAAQQKKLDKIFGGKSAVSKKLTRCHSVAF